MAPTDTPIRNRLNRIGGNGKAQIPSTGLKKLGEFGGYPEKDNTEPSLQREEGVETMHPGRIQKGQKNPWHRVSVIARKAKSGYSAWNKGLTKHDHPSIMKYAKSRIGDKNPIWKREDAELFLLSNGLKTRILYRGSIDNPSPKWRRQFSVNQKRSLLKKADYKCRECGEVLTYDTCEADHIIPVALGGRTIIANGQALCHKCHLAKTRQDKKRIRQDIVRTLQKCKEGLRNVALATI
jgi:hypothetical protein